MEKIIINDIVPILVIMVLGYWFGKITYFTDEQRQGFNKLVLNVALPAALFVSIVKATREMLFQDISLKIVSLIGVIGMFMLCFWLCKALFHHTTEEAAVCALCAGSPTIGFLGYVVVDRIWGTTVTGNLIVAIVAIIVNAITIPIGFYLISIGLSRREHMKASTTETTGSSDSILAISPDQPGYKKLSRAEKKIEKAEANFETVSYPSLKSLDFLLHR